MTLNMITKLMILMLYWPSSEIIVAATRCYNCGTENTDTCDNFDPNNSTFIVDCPRKFSCGLQIHVDKKIRTCEEYFLDDCKEANSVEYCYCTGDLCNGITIHFTQSDDEDFIEGSGTGTTTTIITNQTTISMNRPTTFKPLVITKSPNGQDGRVTVNLFLIFLFYPIFLVI